MRHTTYHSLLQSLSVDDKTVILTPNRRLARALHVLYNEQQRISQKMAWETPAILPLNAWVKKYFQQYTESALENTLTLLNAAQTHHLWQRIIRQHMPTLEEVQIENLSTLAESAFERLTLWEIDPTKKTTWLLHEESTHHYVFFYRISRAFQAHCKRSCLLPEMQLIPTLAALIKKNAIRPDHKLILVGFTEISPALQTLLRYFKTHLVEAAPETATTTCYAFKTTDEEIISMATWAKSRLEDGAKTIGCIVPTLDQMRETVLQVFSEIVGKDNINLSAGKPAHLCPPIKQALQLLKLYIGTTTIDDLTALLHSPFIGQSEQELEARAQLNLTLRKKNIHTLTLPSSLFTQAPAFHRAIQNFFNLLPTRETTQTYYQWGKQFEKLLNTFGFPGERSLNSEEYQMVKHLEQLFHTLATLDQVSPPCTMAHAYQALKMIAASSTFQPETKTAPVQILGLLEGAGLPLDAIWVMGLHDRAYPPAPKPHPFIPKAIQRLAEMPHATAERELIYCETLLSQFKQNTPHLILSYAEKEGDEQRGKSPLLKDIAENNFLLEHKIATGSDIKIFNTRQIENTPDTPVPMVETIAPGGSQTLKDQASCPFKAFATWRLGIRVVEDPTLGMHAKARGRLLHEVLACLWETLKDHATLKTYTKDALLVLTAEAIDAIYQKIRNDLLPFEKRATYLQLEKERLITMIVDWLELEKERPPFSVIAKEKAVEVTLGQLQFKLRIDRIDCIGEQHFIIDYKSSANATINEWLSDRPDEPQLPLYATLDPDKTLGIAFATLRTNQPQFKGLSKEALHIPGVKHDATWHTKLKDWQAALTRLSNDFSQGTATVDPKYGAQTCERCHLHALCRMKETIE